MSLNWNEFEAHTAAIPLAVKRSAEAGGGLLYPLDFLAWAVGNRSAGLSRGFRTLIEAGNYMPAGALVRLQLDTSLRFMAAWHVNNPHDFATAVLGGTRVDHLKDRSGKKLRDARLVELAAPEGAWIARVYSETSGFVHLSDKHIFAAVSGEPEGRTIQMHVADSDSSSAITDQVRQEAIDGFVAALALCLKYLHGWAATKDRKMDA